MNYYNNTSLQSYNCFYSAICSDLEKYYGEDTQLIVNNRWQLFYKDGENYSDDYRFIGEHSMLYDEEHLLVLKKLAGIKIYIIQTQGQISEINNKLQKDGYVFIFANRFCYDNREHPSGARCVTTLCLDNYKNDMYHYLAYDSDIYGDKWVDREFLLRSWRYASEFAHLNSAYIKIELDSQKLSYDDIRLIYIKSMLDSLHSYLNGFTVNQYTYGNQSLNVFANEIEKWNGKQYEKFVDCSMYINIILRQRQFLLKSLRHFIRDDIFYIKEKEFLAIIKLWDRLKYVIFLMGMRRQTDTVSFLIDQIKEIQAREYEYAAYLYKYMLRNLI